MASLTRRTAEVMPSSDGGIDKSVRDVFLAWEKLRVLYVALLVFVVLGLDGVRALGDRQSCFAIIEGAVAANVLYFAGPLAEAYFHWLGIRWRWLRMTLFTAGTLLAIGLTAFVMLGIALAHMMDDLP